MAEQHELYRIVSDWPPDFLDGKDKPCLVLDVVHRGSHQPSNCVSVMLLHFLSQDVHTDPVLLLLREPLHDRGYVIVSTRPLIFSVEDESTVRRLQLSAGFLETWCQDRR